MRNTLTKLVLVLVSVGMVSLVGCSTNNTQAQNTGLGAVGGGVVGGVGTAIAGGNPAAIAAGAVIGAIVGGVVGHNMDSSDNMRATSAMDKPVETRTTWHNRHTNTYYTMVPMSGWMTVNGNPNCRKYKATMWTKSGKKKHMYGVACRQSNGSWVAVS